MQRNVVQYRSLAVAEVEVAEFDLPRRMVSAGIAGSAAESSMAGSALSNSSMRTMEAVPRWNRFTTQPTAMMGQMSMTM